MELLVALGAAMPERYRPDIRADEISVRLRPLATWTTDELVAGVLAATTTEARLYLAKALAFSCDWRTALSIDFLERGVGAPDQPATGTAAPSRR
jgi:hypothetical protein